MAASKRPRKAHKPRALHIPMAFALTPEMSTSLGLRDRAHIDSVLSGSGNDDDLAAAISVCVTMVALCRDAKARPDAHQVDASGISDALEDLTSRIAPALSSVRDRRDETGRIGVTGEERQALLGLADLADQLRANLPRRMYHAALGYAIKHPSLRLAEMEVA